MANGDILVYDEGTFPAGTKKFKVHADAGVTTAAPGINAGEFVLIGLGTSGKYVTKWGVSVSTKPAVGSHYLAGLAMSASTNTTSLDGTVEVLPILPGMTFLIAPVTAGSWDTQSEYDALVGSRILITTTAAGIQQLAATDYGGNATNGLGNGLVVEPLDILKYPGKVRVSVKQRCVYNN